MIINREKIAVMLGIGGLTGLTALGVTAIICGSSKENEAEKIRLEVEREQIEQEKQKLQEAYQRNKMAQEKIRKEKDDLSKREADIKVKLLEIEKIKDGIDDILREFKKRKE